MSPTTRSRGLNAARNTGIDAAAARPARVRRRRRRRAARLAGRAAGRRCRGGAGGRRPDRPDPRPLRGPSLALLRARAAADHDAGPRPARPRRRARLGREHDRAPDGDRPRRALRRGARAVRRRAGVAGPAARRGRADPLRRGGRARPPPRRRRRAPALARRRRLPPRRGEPALRRRSSDARPRSRTSCACWPAAPCTPSASRARTGSCSTAHQLGRLRAAAAASGGRGSGAVEPDPDFLSGESGTVRGLRRPPLRALDTALDLEARPRLRRIDRAARSQPAARSVLVLGVERPGRLMTTLRAELHRTRHEVQMHTVAMGDAGKFEHLNALLAAHPAAGHDWLLVVDDDVVVGPRFLDRFLLCAERRRSAARPARPPAPLARRLGGDAAAAGRRRARVALRRDRAADRVRGAGLRDAAAVPGQLRMGWGLDAHWGAVAQAQRLAGGDRRRHADAAHDAGRRRLRARRRGRRGAGVPRGRGRTSRAAQARWSRRLA